jgi:deoxycytidylate deaminase
LNAKKFSRLIEISRALKAQHSGLRCFHTTFILFKGKILSIGVNSAKTHPSRNKYNYFSETGEDLRNQVGIHSEISAILKLGREDLSGCVFVNIRTGNEGKILMSKPCLGCSSALKQFRYKQLFYSDNQGNFSKL